MIELNIKYRDMRKMGLLAAAFGMMILGISCEEFDGMFDDFGVRVNSDYYEIELVIPPAPQGIQVYVHTLMKSDLEEIVENYGDASATIDKVEVLDAYIEVVEGSKVTNLNAVESIRTTIATDLLEEKTIATCINDTIDATMLPMIVEAVNISDYVDAEEYRLTNYGTLKDAITDTLKVRGRLRYQVLLNVSTQTAE